MANKCVKYIYTTHDIVSIVLCIFWIVGAQQALDTFQNFPTKEEETAVIIVNIYVIMSVITVVETLASMLVVSLTDDVELAGSFFTVRFIVSTFLVVGSSIYSHNYECGKTKLCKFYHNMHTYHIITYVMEAVFCLMAKIVPVVSRNSEKYGFSPIDSKT